MSDSFGIICKAKVNRIISRNNPRTIERHFAISRNTGVKCLSFLRFTDACDFRKGGQRNGAQAKNSNRFGPKGNWEKEEVCTVSGGSGALLHGSEYLP